MKENPRPKVISFEKKNITQMIEVLFGCMRCHRRFHKE
jgi:hypothetical protein